MVTLWTGAHQPSVCMGFPRREGWSGLLFPSPGDLPSPGIIPRSPTMQADSLVTGEEGRRELNLLLSESFMLTNFLKLLETVRGGRGAMETPTLIFEITYRHLPSKKVATACHSLWAVFSLISSLLQPPISNCLRDKCPTKSDFLLCPATSVLCPGPVSFSPTISLPQS